MKVSIIVPVYNAERQIKECLRSVFAQSYKNIELILVNDCSRDRSMEIARNYVNENPHDITVTFIDLDANRGASAARNTGIDAAHGEYIYFLDSDDQITPDCIEALVKPLEKKKYDFVIGDFIQIGDRPSKWALRVPEGEIMGNKAIFHAHSHQQIYVFPFNKLCRVDFIKNNGLYFHEGITHEDALWSLMCAMVADAVYVVQRVTYHYYIWNTSVGGRESDHDIVTVYVRLSSLMNQAIESSPVQHDKEDVMHFLDDIFKDRYIVCVSNNWKQEYFALRKNDKRPIGYVLKNCMQSFQYLRSHGHRLFSPLIGFKLYSFIDKVYLSRVNT